MTVEAVLDELNEFTEFVAKSSEVWNHGGNP
jgi:hypothetical protein